MTVIEDLTKVNGSLAHSIGKTFIWYEKGKPMPIDSYTDVDNLKSDYISGPLNRNVSFQLSESSRTRYLENIKDMDLIELKKYIINTYYAGKKYTKET